MATNQRAGAGFDLWFGDVSLHRGACTTPNPAAPGGGPALRRVGRVGRAVHARRRRPRRHRRHRLRGGGRQRRLPADVLVRRRRLSATPLRRARPATPRRGNSRRSRRTPSGPSPSAACRGSAPTARTSTSAIRTTAASAPPPAVPPPCPGPTSAAATASTRPAKGRAASPPSAASAAARATRMFLSGAGLTGASPEITNYPNGNMRSFEHLNSIVNFGTNAYVAATSSGVFVTLNMGAAPTWTAARRRAARRHQLRPAGGDAGRHADLLRQDRRLQRRCRRQPVPLHRDWQHRQLDADPERRSGTLRRLRRRPEQPAEDHRLVARRPDRPAHGHDARRRYDLAAAAGARRDDDRRRRLPVPPRRPGRTASRASPAIRSRRWSPSIRPIPTSSSPAPPTPASSSAPTAGPAGSS